MRGIGQMARESGLTVSALRFYDGAGVLPPARVDPHSNYRWYSDDQVRTARLIARLRRVGLPLAEIGRVLENRWDLPAVDEILRAHLTRLEEGLADARRELSAARALLDQESPVTTQTRIETDAAALRSALRAVRYAVSANPELPMLTGVLLDVDGRTDGDAVRVAATDRYRLAVSVLAGAEVTGPAASVLAPVSLVDDLLALLDGDGAVSVHLAGAEIVVDLGDRTLRARRLDHEFPDYRRLIRPGAEHTVDVDAARLRAEVLAAPTRTVRQEETGTEHEVSVLTLTADGGIGIAPGTAGVLEMGLNREFLLQALDAGGSGQLVLELDSPIAPLAIRVPGRAGDVSMLMPVRLT